MTNEGTKGAKAKSVGLKKQPPKLPQCLTPFEDETLQKNLKQDRTGPCRDRKKPNPKG
jgi:hypothetical protein